MNFDFVFLISRLEERVNIKDISLMEVWKLETTLKLKSTRNSTIIFLLHKQYANLTHCNNSGACMHNCIFYLELDAEEIFLLNPVS